MDARCAGGRLVGAPPGGVRDTPTTRPWAWQTCERAFQIDITPCPVPSFDRLGPLSSRFIPSPFPCHGPPRCTPPLSRLSSSLPASASTPRPTRPPSSLPMPPLRHSKDRQGPTSVGRPLIKPRYARTHTVSARPETSQTTERKIIEPPVFFFQLVNSLDDFCIYAPPNPGPDSAIGNTEVRRVRYRHVYENEYDRLPPFQAHRSVMVYEGMWPVTLLHPPFAYRLLTGWLWNAPYTRWYHHWRAFCKDTRLRSSHWYVSF